MDSEMMSELGRLIRRKPSATSAQLAIDLTNTTGRRVSTRTIQNARRSLGYHHVQCESETPPHCRQSSSSLGFMQDARTYVMISRGGRVFADETDFELDAHNRLFWITRGEERPVEYQLPTRCKVNVCAAIYNKDRSTLHFTKHTINSERYESILEHHLSPILPLRLKIFVHDRVPWHRTQNIINWLAEHGVQEMEDFNVSSPDLNDIEYVELTQACRVGSRAT